MAATDTEDTFVTVPGDPPVSEVARKLAKPVPRPEFPCWTSSGCGVTLASSLLGFAGAIFVLQPGGAGTRSFPSPRR